MSLNKIRLHFFFFFFFWKLSYNIVVSNQTWKSYHKFFIYSHQTWNASTNSVNRISTQSCVTYDAGFKERATRDVLQKSILENFGRFTGKHLCQCLLFKVTGLRSANVLKKTTWHRFFPVNFAKFSRTRFLQNISGRLLLILLGSQQILKQKRWT